MTRKKILLVIVEGPSDELIVQKAYMKKQSGHLPIQDNIDVISVKGIQAKRFLTLVGDLPIRIAVITDNDGDYDNNITAFIFDINSLFSFNNLL